MIIRIKKSKENPYVIMDKRALQEAGLSWKAKGILAYLLSLPDDWQIYLEELTTHSTDGITSLRTGMNELEEFGYVKKAKARGEGGKFIGYEWEVHERPAKKTTEIRNSNLGESKLRESETTNYTLNKLNNKLINVPDGLPDGSHQAIVRALSQLTGMDMKIRTNAGRIVSAAKQLKDAGYTAEHIHTFGRLWRKDWRYKQDRQPPALTTVVSEISKVKKHNGATAPETRLAAAMAEIENAEQEINNDGQREN